MVKLVLQRESGQYQRVRFSSPERESAFSRTVNIDDRVVRRSSHKRHSSLVELSNDAQISGSYQGGMSLRASSAGLAGSTRSRSHSLSVELPHSAQTAFMSTAGSSFGGLAGGPNSQPRTNSSISGSSLRRYASSFELSSAGKNAGTFLNRASSPTRMSPAIRSYQYGSFTRDANILAGGSSARAFAMPGHRAGAGAITFQGSLARDYDASAFSGSVFPRNPARFQEVSYLPSVGILGDSLANSRGWVGGQMPVGYSDLVSGVGLNRAFSGSTGMLSNVGLHTSGGAAYPPNAHNAQMMTASVSAGDTTSAINSTSILVSSGQPIDPTGSHVSVTAGSTAASVSISSDQQVTAAEQEQISAAGASHASCDDVTTGSTAASISISQDQQVTAAEQEQISAADMTQVPCDDVTPGSAVADISN